ncbi:MAG: sulfur reduction protein DsrJ [Hyphomicrobiales bacterium]|nr:sulfur reduction protein DsrJ [Hyphomicrobiales bacterium]
MTSRIASLTRFTILPVLMVMITLVSGIAHSESRVPEPVIELPTESEQCIRPKEFMRRNHMNLLKHKRDATMRQGIRTEDASLQGCVDCHAIRAADGSAIPVNAPGQFCSTCHEYAAVKLDCFECHRTTPEQVMNSTRLPDTPVHDRHLAANDAKVINLQNYLNEAQ